MRCQFKNELGGLVKNCDNWTANLLHRIMHVFYKPNSLHPLYSFTSRTHIPMPMSRVSSLLSEICALMGYCAVLSGSSVPMFRGQPIGRIFNGQEVHEERDP
jgi:hypothetical protein